MNAVAFFGRGVKIQSLPDLVPDSIYAHRIGLHNPNATVPIQGRYSKAGTSIPLTSEEEVRKAMTEISGGKSPMMWIKIHRLSGMPHVAFCKIRESPVVAEMMR